MSAKPEAAPDVEHDGPKWAEPLSAMYARIRYGSYLLVGALVVIAVQSVLLFTLGARAAAHVYEVRPDGEAAYIGDRESNIASRPAEARYIARRFVELLYDWNSSTVAQDVAAATSMCSPIMAKELRDELALSQFVDKIRSRNIRSEIAFDKVEVADQGRRDFRVRVVGSVRLFGLAQHAGEALDTRRFAVTVVMAAVPRDPELRLNGLEIVRIQRDEQPAAIPTPAKKEDEP